MIFCLFVIFNNHLKQAKLLFFIIQPKLYILEATFFFISSNEKTEKICAIVYERTYVISETETLRKSSRSDNT